MARDYTDIYARYGLLRGNSLLGHCIHLSDREIGALAEGGPGFQAPFLTAPTSNLFFWGRGLLTMPSCAGGGLTNAIATDIGGGTSYSLLQTLAGGLQGAATARPAAAPLPRVSLDYAGQCRGFGADRPHRHAGTGHRGADFVVLNGPTATPAMAQRMETVARGLAGMN